MGEELWGWGICLLAPGVHDSRSAAGQWVEGGGKGAFRARV